MTGPAEVPNAELSNSPEPVHPKLQFVLKGFRENGGFRIFAFEGVAADWTRLGFAVRADLALVRQYSIRLQELPLLCRAFLEQCYQTQGNRALTYSEADMQASLKEKALNDKTGNKRKPPRRPVTANVGTAWR